MKQKDLLALPEGQRRRRTPSSSFLPFAPQNVTGLGAHASLTIEHGAAAVRGHAPPLPLRTPHRLGGSISAHSPPVPDRPLLPVPGNCRRFRPAGSRRYIGALAGLSSIVPQCRIWRFWDELPPISASRIWFSCIVIPGYLFYRQSRPEPLLLFRADRLLTTARRSQSRGGDFGSRTLSGRRDRFECGCSSDPSR